MPREAPHHKSVGQSCLYAQIHWQVHSYSFYESGIIISRPRIFVSFRRGRTYHCEMVESCESELLRQFTESGSETAFTTLVEQHVPLVYSTALRRTANPHQAQEIAQVVFIIFARKASSLRKETVLSGWFYHTTRLTAENWRRAETRRARREEEALMRSTLNEESNEPAWERISPVLDEVMGELGATDRDAVVLRFFENKSLREVGARLGLEERAAQKRVTRALEKLRRLFGKRGIGLTTMTMAAALSAHAVQAAPDLAGTIAVTALTGTALDCPGLKARRRR